LLVVTIAGTYRQAEYSGLDLVRCCAALILLSVTAPVMAAPLSNADAATGAPGLNNDPAPMTASPNRSAETDSDESLDFLFNGFAKIATEFTPPTSTDLAENIQKREIQNHLEVSFGPENINVYAAANQYYQVNFGTETSGPAYHYADETTFARNLAVYAPEYELNFNELYFHYSRNNVRLRAGNQLYRWGTADGLNPTAYFNPVDIRELFFRHDEEARLGIPSLSGLFFSSDFTLELVLAPLHVPHPAMPRGNFWSIDLATPLYVVYFEKPEALPISLANAGFGARLSGHLFGGDFAVSAFHGPDKEPVYLPVWLAKEADQPAVIGVASRTFVISMLGLDFSRSFNDFVIQFEAAYSPQKYGLPDYPNLGNLVNQPWLAEWADNTALESALSAKMKLPLAPIGSEFLSFSLGFNYFLPLHAGLTGQKGLSILTVEWFQSKFFNEYMAKSLATDLLILKYSDSFFHGRINTTLSVFFEAAGSGTILWPQVSYNFDHGFGLTLAYAAISAGKPGNSITQSEFYYFQSNDIFMLELCYSY
jgi:hypothetical protein